MDNLAIHGGNSSASSLGGDLHSNGSQLFSQVELGVGATAGANDEVKEFAKH